ncbi:MAG: hypothetical protein DMD35_21460, partial [Gemmatimonadetes bacterium]
MRSSVGSSSATTPPCRHPRRARSWSGSAADRPPGNGGGTLGQHPRNAAPAFSPHSLSEGGTVTEILHQAEEHPSDPLLPRHTLAGRYVIERQLGRGGMATVYLATDVRHQRPVAVKVLRQEVASALNVKRFLREIRIACGLVHPHILPLHDSGESDGRIFFAMPYVEGETLHRRIRREGRLSVDEAVRLTREVADALGYAHEHGIVHRDIKPENILLSGGHAVVADFGISRATGDTLTDLGVVVGTPQYMSPEQASGQHVLGPPSDIYSLACVLFTMLIGAPPFDGPNAQAIA